MASEQTKVIVQLTFDFQEQSRQFGHSLQTAVSDVDAPFKVAITLVASVR
jgi:hypothetical protein